MIKPKLAHESWVKCPAFELVPDIMAQLTPGTYKPQPGPNIFRAFEMPVDDVKAVIVGLSPYPGTFIDGTDHACGYAFAIEKELSYYEWPKSLQKIGDAIGAITKQDPIDKYLVTDLSMWRQQGVLLLNTALTALPSAPTAHLELWSAFSKVLIGWLNDNKQDIIFYFMGKEAAKLSSLVYPLRNYVLASEHPARAAYEDRDFKDKFVQFASLYKSIYKKDFEFTLPF